MKTRQMMQSECQPGDGTLRNLSLWALLCGAMALDAQAQPIGVFPEGGNDAQAAQLADYPASAETWIWSVDYSHHTVVKKDFISHIIDEYDSNGMETTRYCYDTSDQLDSKTIFQYTDNGQKRVSTTYSKTGERTLQTLYAYTADGYLARMRFTDADAVTISTTEVGIANGSTTTQEIYNDSEKVTTTYFYDKSNRLTRIVKTDGQTTSDMKLALTYSGLPARGNYSTSSGVQQAYTYEHKVDGHGNWIRKVTYVDGQATEVAERRITY